MRTCSACNNTKPIADFYKHPTGPEGRMSKCRDCHKAYQRTLRLTNSNARAYDRERAALPERKEHNAKVSRRWRTNNPDAYRAQTALNNAIRDGRVKRGPCLFCEVQTKVHAHHRDYSKALEVIWLCPKCHHRLHKFFPETEGGGKGAEQ